MAKKTKLSAQEKFALVRQEMAAALIEREEEVDVVLVALICGEHPLLVGPPGTAKSLLLDSIARWVNAPKFDYLLTKFTDPMELFGPVDIVALKNRVSQRVVAGMMPEATVAFMDEIFKASSAILNTLLKILNERKFKYGQQEVDCPLRICVAASNEWPNDQDGAQELGALFDRFLLRKTVSPVSPAGRKRLLWDRNHQPKFTETITIEELDEARQEAEELEWSDEAVEALNRILDHLNAQGISPGDRRMYKSVLVAQAYAWMQGADEVLPEHLEVLKHCLWVDPHEQPIKTAQIVARIANPTGYAINEKMAQAFDVIAKNTPTEAVPKLQEIQKELIALPHHPRRAAAEKWLQEQIKTQYHKVIGA